MEKSQFEMIASSIGATAASGKVKEKYDHLIRNLGPELLLLRKAPLKDIELVAGPYIAEGIRRLRCKCLNTSRSAFLISESNGTFRNYSFDFPKIFPDCFNFPFIMKDGSRVIGRHDFNALFFKPLSADLGNLGFRVNEGFCGQRA